MQCSAVQCSAVQCSAVQCSAVQYSAVQCSAVQFSAVPCSAVQCSAVQCTAVQCSAVQYSAVLCSTVQCSTVQCSAVQCSAVQYSEVPFVLPDFNAPSTVSTNFRALLKHSIHDNPSVYRQPSCRMQQTDRYDQVNSRFSQFCENAQYVPEHPLIVRSDFFLYIRI